MEETVTLEWHLFLRASSSKAAEKLMRRFFERLQLDFAPSELERYWKDDALVVSRGKCDFPIVAAPEAVFDLLSRLHAVASRVSVSGPSFYEDGRWELEAQATAGKPVGEISLTGLELMTVRLIGSDHRTSQPNQQ